MRFCILLLLLKPFLLTAGGNKIPTADTFGKYAEIKYSPYQTHIHIILDDFSVVGMVIDLISTDNTAYQGYLSCYTIHEKDTTIDMVVTQIRDREFYHRYQLDNTVAGEVARNLLKSGQATIDSASLSFPQNLIIHDCFADVFEFKLGDNYTKQVLFCPHIRNESLSFRNSSVFRDIINPNLTFLKSVLKLDSFMEAFYATLPKYGCYHYGGLGKFYSVKQKVIKTDAEWKYRKASRRYMKSVQDTLKDFLESKVAINFNRNKFDCPNKFYLLFSKQGKLKWITTDSDLWKKEEVDRYESCKRQIFKAFRKINLTFIHPPGDYEVILSVNGNIEFWPELTVDH